MVGVSVSHRCLHPLHLAHISAPCYFSHKSRLFQRFPFSDPTSWVGKSRIYLSWATETERCCQAVLQYTVAQGTALNHSQKTSPSPFHESHIYPSRSYILQKADSWVSCIYPKPRSLSETKKTTWPFCHGFGEIFFFEEVCSLHCRHSSQG